MIKTCKICGKEFEGERNTRLCSDECRRENKRLSKNAYTTAPVEEWGIYTQGCERQYTATSARSGRRRYFEWVINNLKIPARG